LVAPDRKIANVDNFNREYYIEELHPYSPLRKNLHKMVLGGKEAENELASMSVFLQTKDSSCSGTIISHDIILTAAHCIDSKTKEIEIYFNNDFEKPYTSTKFAKLISFPENEEIERIQRERYSNDHLDFDFDEYKSFQSYFDNLTELDYRPLEKSVYYASSDLALVFLENPLPENAKIASMFSGKLKFKQKFIGVGYGVTSRNYHEKTNNKLRYTEMKLFAAYHLRETILSLSVHSGHYSKNTCAGDSGGGLFEKKKEGKYQLIGVLSSGNNNCANSKLYTLIHPYYDWLEEEITNFRSKKEMRL
jgi:V8-like Glu-specific endopeptidase